MLETIMRYTLPIAGAFLGCDLAKCTEVSNEGKLYSVGKELTGAFMGAAIGAQVAEFVSHTDYKQYLGFAPEVKE